jgi:ATP-dependent Lhr-like helicase
LCATIAREHSREASSVEFNLNARRGGQVPKFETLFGEEVHTRLLQEMKTVYEDVDVPEFLDAAAKALLAGGRDAYRRGSLANRKVLEKGDSVMLFPWVGSSTVAALSVALSGLGVKSEDNGVGLTAAAGLDQTIDSLSRLAELTPTELGNIEHNALGLCTEKYDEFVPSTLLQQFWGRRNESAIRSIPKIARELLASVSRR